MHQRLASRRSPSLIPQKPRQRENPPATASVRVCCIISREREKMPEIASFLSLLTTLGPLLAGGPAPPLHPTPSDSCKVKWKNLLFNLFDQNPSSTPIWAHEFGAPDGGLHARPWGSEGEAAPIYSPARHHGYSVRAFPLMQLPWERVLNWEGFRKVIWQHLSNCVPFHAAIRLLSILPAEIPVPVYTMHARRLCLLQRRIRGKLNV